MASAESRRDRRWQARYARSQQAIERTAAREDVEPREPWVAPLERIVAPDGGNHILRLVAPDEPVRHEGWWSLGGLLAARAGGLRSRRGTWVVVLERQRGPWRGFDTVVEEYFSRYADAARHAVRLREAIKRGGPPPGRAAGSPGHEGG